MSAQGYEKRLQQTRPILITNIPSIPLEKIFGYLDTFDALQFLRTSKAMQHFFKQSFVYKTWQLKNAFLHLPFTTVRENEDVRETPSISVVWIPLIERNGYYQVHPGYEDEFATQTAVIEFTKPSREWAHDDIHLASLAMASASTQTDAATFESLMVNDNWLLQQRGSLELFFYHRHLNLAAYVAEHRPR